MLAVVVAGPRNGEVAFAAKAQCAGAAPPRGASPASAWRALRPARLLAALPALADAEAFGRVKRAGALRLQDGRSEALARYNRSAVQIRDALAGGAASFYSFTFANPELTVNVVDRSVLNDRYWAFGSIATEVDCSVRVTGHATSLTLRYHRNSRKPLINDGAASPCGP